jgi:hypothetical protein
MPKRNGKRPLVREGEPRQRTKEGVEIPIPTRKDVFDLLDKAARKRQPTKRTGKSTGRESGGV